MNTSPAAPEHSATSTEPPAPAPGPDPAASGDPAAPDGPAASGDPTVPDDPAAPGVVRRTDPARRTAYRALAVALGCGVVGASLVLLAAGKTWARGTASSAGHAMPVHAGGSQMTALPGALALVGLASLVAIFAVRRIGRYTVAALLALSGLGAAATALARRGDHGALDAAAATATSLTHATAAHTSTTGWPYVSVAGGLLLLIAGLTALRYGSRWPAMSSRYDRPTGRAAAPPAIDPDRPEDLWKALDRGEDPTAP
ncbi:putative membrane protein [Actinacidiphila reveromycinica]|uniref:Putative membrane protein n=1 Tax=Actinacidiphila reveromycinica TaxID=659352 RepID=A0A7U3VMK3_9ACTN|nr:putative membrane protein [Streptomyces sp. SN-593]